MGIDPELCLESTGINLGDLDTPTAQFSTEQEIAAIENFVRLAPSKVGLGVAVGRLMHVNAFGIWGFAILTSPTLRVAIETSIEYVRLSFVIADMKLIDFDGRARLEFDMSDLPSTTHRYVLERHSVVAMTFVQELVQASKLEHFEIETPDKDAAYVRELSNLVGIRVIGEMRAYALTFPAEFLDRPLPKSDPVSLQYCLDQCKVRVDELDGALLPWSQKVRDAVIDEIGEEKKIEEIAEKLSVTERTLRRRLTEEGTNFRELYTDARMVIAHELLETAGLNVETVSWRVGYSEPASFARAFARKFGKTPGEVRRKRA
jgi:AraC-like DNA-binding protein